VKEFFRERISRRDFLRRGCLFLASLGLSVWPFLRKGWAKGQVSSMREAMFYKKLEKGDLRCEICFRRCIIKEGNRGFCRNKENSGGRL